MTSERLELDEPSKSVLADARKLQRRKERKATGRFLVEGRQAVREALRTPGLVESLFVRWAQARENVDLVEDARAAGVPVYAVSEQNLATLTDTVTPQGIVAVSKQLDVPLADLLVECEEPLSAPVLQRARLVRLMKTAAAIQEKSDSRSVRRLADTLVQQLVEIMPELKGVTAWHSVGQRRSLEELGRIVERAFPDNFFSRH